jgi:hypothetical protein
MNLELARHRWPQLGTAGPDPAHLPDALLELCQAPDSETAGLAAARIERVVFALGQLSEASAAVAAALVHGLWSCTDHAIAPAVNILLDIADGFVDENDPDAFGPASVEQCLFEIRAGFPAYVEILDSSAAVATKAAVADLIATCGLSDGRLRERSIFFLARALDAGLMPGHEAALVSSIEELRAEPPSQFHEP